MRVNPKSLVIPRDGCRHVFHRRLELLMKRSDVKPFLQDVVWGQSRELFDDRRLMCIFGADHDAVRLPATGFRWFYQQHHLPAEQVDGQSTKHPLGEEAGMVLEDLKDPLVIERFHLRTTGSRQKYCPAFNVLPPLDDLKCLLCIA